MPLIIRGGLFVWGLFAVKDIVSETGTAAEKSSKLVKWVVIGGVLYYGGKAVGVIK